MNGERHLGSERGSALIVAVLVMVVVALLATVAVSVAAQNSRSDRRDSNEKSAIEAAEAGLQVANYRLNMLGPDGAHCVGDSVALPDATGTCASSAYSLGNGSTYRYYTTPALGVSATCVGATLSNATSIAQRCVTAVGTTNGVVQRAQVRVAAFTAAPLFPYAGITGLGGITLNGNASINGSVASNKVITLNGNVSVGAVVLGPGTGKLSTSGNVTHGQVTTLTSPIVLDPVNPGTSNQASLSGCPDRAAAGFPACNDDYRIVNGLANPTTAPYDQVKGVSYNAATRSLTMSGNSSWTLGGGIYNFCQISQSGNSTITLAPGVKAEIIIDSPDDPGSGCPAGSGNVSMSGNVTWVNPTADPTALQLFAYGLNNNSSSFQVAGNGTFYGVIYAPHSAVTLNGNATVTGAISGYTVALNGNAFNWSPSAGTLVASSNGVYYRTAWAQCTPTAPTMNAPGSGCG